MNLKIVNLKNANKLFKNHSISDYKKYVNDYIIDLLKSNIFKDASISYEEKKIYINDYIIPLLNILYSNYYTDYFLQNNRTTQLKINLNEIKNLELMYNYNNPIIEKVNIFFYKHFLQKKNTDKNKNKGSGIISNNFNLTTISDNREKLKENIDNFIKIVEKKQETYTEYEQLKNTITGLVGTVNTDIKNINESFTATPTATANAANAATAAIAIKPLDNKITKAIESDEAAKATATATADADADAAAKVAKAYADADNKTEYKDINNNLDIKIKNIIDDSIKYYSNSNDTVKLKKKITTFFQHAIELRINLKKIEKFQKKPINFQDNINLFKEVSRIYSTEIKSYRKFMENPSNNKNNSNLKTIKEEKLVAFTKQNYTKFIEKIQILNKKKYNNKINISQLLLDLKKDDGDPMNNMVTSITKLIIYDTYLNKLFIDFKYSKTTPDGTLIEYIEKIIKDIKKIKVDVEFILNNYNDNVNKKSSNNNPITDLKNYYTLLRDEDDKPKNFNGSEKDYFKQITKKDEHLNNIEKLSACMKEINSNKKYIIYNFLKKQNDKSKTVVYYKDYFNLTNNNILNIYNSINGKSVKDAIAFLKSEIWDYIANSSSYQRIQSFLTKPNTENIISLIDQKIAVETTELNKINLKESKDKFTKGLYYTSYEKIIKILDTKKEDSPKNKNNTSSINLKKTMEELIRKYFKNDQKYIDYIHQVQQNSSSDNPLNYLLFTKDNLFKKIFEQIKEESFPINIKNFNALKENIIEYIINNKKTKLNKNMFMVTLKNELISLDDPSVKLFFDDIFNYNNKLLKQINNKTNNAIANIPINDTNKDSLNKVQKEITTLLKKIDDIKLNSLKKTKNMINIFPYTDVIYLYFYILIYLNLFFEILEK